MGKKLNITFFFETEGTVTNMPENALVEYDTQYILTAVVPEREGYIFVGWKLWDTILDDDAKLRMPAYDITLTAVWEKAKFNVFFTSEGSVSNMPDNVLVEYDTQYIVSNVVP